MASLEEAVYEARAELYDRIYSFKDYRSEVERLRAMLQAEGVADGARLLDAACGTGEHLLHLKRFFDVSGFDKNPAMLEVARQKVPDVPLWEADLRDFTVEAPMQAILCLFSSIGYVHEEEGLGACARSFARALAPGGVLILEPWLTPENCAPGFPSMHTYGDDDLKLCRQAVTEVIGDISAFDMHWLVARRDGEVEHFVERHELRLYTSETMRAALEAAGLEARFEPDGLMPKRGLWIARRPA
jgi:daunosaminyl-N,N-dimethyltransferase/N-dimethyltransferase